jgi:tyrosine-protein kinase Etk/Wzc
MTLATPARPSTNPEPAWQVVDTAFLWHKYRKMSLIVIAACLVAGLIASLVMPNVYKARATILSPEQPQSAAAAMLGQFGVLAGFAGKDLGIKDPTAQMIGVLKSRTMADHIIDRFHLESVYHVRLRSDARESLAQATTLTAGKSDGIITIEVEDRDPKRAADIANAYPEELALLTQNLAFSEASQRRLFFEKQLENVRGQLSNAENELKMTQEKSGVIQPEGQAKAIIEAYAAVSGQIAAKEVQLQSMRSFATPNNPDLQHAESELAALKVQLAKIEGRKDRESGNIQIPTERIPTLGLEYIRKFRDVKYYETVYELLAKQFEAAKIDEARQGAIIQVLDRATEPDKRSRPIRSLIMLLALSSGIMLCAAWIAIVEYGWNRRFRRI